MQLTESQHTALTHLAESIDKDYDGHAFLKEVIALKRQGVDVYEALQTHHGIILTEDDTDDEDDTDEGENDERT